MSWHRLCSRRPRTAGSRSKRRVQYPSLITATGCAPSTRSSSDVSKRPIAGRSPKRVNRSPDTYCTHAFSRLDRLRTRCRSWRRTTHRAGSRRRWRRACAGTRGTRRRRTSAAARRRRGLADHHVQSSARPGQRPVQQTRPMTAKVVRHAPTASASDTMPPPNAASNLVTWRQPYAMSRATCRGQERSERPRCESAISERAAKRTRRQRQRRRPGRRRPSTVLPPPRGGTELIVECVDVAARLHQPTSRKRNHRRLST